MPTKTSKPSPFQIPPALIGTAVKAGAGALGGGYTAGLGELKQIKEKFKEEGFKEAKFGKKLKMLGGAGLRLFGAYQQGMLGGAVKGVTGSDMGIGSVGLLADNQPGTEEVEEQPTYTTNINTMGEEIPNKMEKPFKALSPYTASYSAYNMSAKEADKMTMMQKLSGVSSLQFTKEGLEKLDAANIKGEFGNIVRKEKNKLEKN